MVACLCRVGHLVVGGIITEHLSVDVPHPTAFDTGVRILPIPAFLASLVPLGVGLFNQRNPQGIGGVGIERPRSSHRQGSRIRPSATCRSTVT